MGKQGNKDSKCDQNTLDWAGEMLQWLRAHTTLTEDQSSVSSTYIRCLTITDTPGPGIRCSILTSFVPTHTCSQTHTHTLIYTCAHIHSYISIHTHTYRQFSETSLFFFFFNSRAIRSQLVCFGRTPFPLTPSGSPHTCERLDTSILSLPSRLPDCKTAWPCLGKEPRPPVALV